jgi:hypothetical protein
VRALNRMEIEDSGPNPERLAAAIHLQLQHSSGPVPVYEIAEALDIVEIREAPMRGLEGAVVTTPDRNVGSIVVNSRSRPLRRRFTLAHELDPFSTPGIDRAIPQAAFPAHGGIWGMDGGEDRPLSHGTSPRRLRPIGSRSSCSREHSWCATT